MILVWLGLWLTVIVIRKNINIKLFYTDSRSLPLKVLTICYRWLPSCGSLCAYYRVLRTSNVEDTNIWA